MLFGMVLMFVMMTSVLVALALWLGRRVAPHLKGNSAAVAALTDHLLVPLLGKPSEAEETDKPKAEKTS